MSDREERTLERDAAAGDLEAQAALERIWGRQGRGWQGEALPAELTRGPSAPLYAIGGPKVVLPFHTVADGVLVPEVAAIYEMTPRPPPAPFETEPVEAVLRAGLLWLLLDMAPAPTTSSRSLGGLIQYSERFRERGGLMVSFGTRPMIQILFDTLGLGESLLCLRATREEALAAISEAAGRSRRA